MSATPRRGPRFAWLDRFILPAGTSLTPSRWHQHLVQRRVSRLDHLRPHRLNWDALKHPEVAAGLEDEPLTPRRLSGIRWSWLDGLFTTVSENLYLGFIVLYALAYGASTSELGLLAAIQNLLGAVSLFPGARAADAARHRKPLVTWTVGGLARVALLALALVPWLTDAPRTAIWLIIGLNGLRSFMSNFGNPAWTVMVGDLVPPRLRAQYFGNRNLMIMLAALVVAPLAGWLIKAGNGWLGQPHLGYQAVFTLAFVTGLAGTVCFILIPEPHRSRRPQPAAHVTTGLWSAVLGNRAFLGLIVSGFVWNLALQVAAPFFNVYLVPQSRGECRHRRAPRRGQHPLRPPGQRPLRPCDGPPGRAPDPGPLRPPHPDHPHGLDLGDRAVADRRPRGLRRARVGRIQPGQLRAAAGAHARRPTVPRPWRSTRRWCSRAPSRARCSEGGSPIPTAST